MDVFNRLYRLETVKNAKDCSRLVSNGSGFSFSAEWARQPTGRGAIELTSLTDLLDGLILNDRDDTWVWNLDDGKIFTVKKLSDLCDEKTLRIGSNNSRTLRNNLVPKKIEVFVWRLMKKRLLVRIELDKRVIDLHSVRCPICDDDIETTDHIVLFCAFAQDIWNRVFRWWGLGSFSNLSFNEILKGNAGVNMSSFGRKLWQAIEWVCVYYIWKNRNNHTFRGSSWSASVTLNEIQVKSFEWISLHSKGEKFEWLTWLSNPFLYLNC
ncbi:uncharacterized protein [Rutidosis leptorrhynchoides]|uniref:uncharacterized protein n=1 Tax=Rutidosis leptorrhynchoides TaxID=125765 RepID=UPI003A99910E